MWHERNLAVTVFLILGCAVGAAAGDVVVDGKVVSNGSGFQFPDGSVQMSAAYPTWHHVAIVDVHGRGDYLDPVTAMAERASWCPAPSATTPCLVKLLPGTYAIGSAGLTMEPYVELEGSGREITVIATSAATAVTAADHSALRSLTVLNQTDLGWVIGVSIQNASFVLRDVRIQIVNIDDYSWNFGIQASDANLTFESIEVTVTGGGSIDGIETDNACTGMIRHATVHTGTHVGVSSGATGFTLRGTSAPAIVESEVSIETAHAGHGILIFGPDVFMRDVRVNVEAAGFGGGFANDGSGTVELNGGWIRLAAGGSAYGLGAYGGTTIVREAQIYGKSTSDSASGVTSVNSANLILERVTATGEGGTVAYGVLVHTNAGVKATDVIARAFGASTYNYGLHTSSSVPFAIEGSALTASGGGGSWGVLNSGTGGAGGTIDHSTLTGGTKAVRNDNTSADLFVGDSKLTGGVTANLTCFGNYDETYAAVTCP